MIANSLQQIIIARNRRRTTAAKQPLAQTQLVLDELELMDAINDERWDKLNQSMDLLFAKFSELENNQVQMKAQLDLNSEVIAKGTREQVTMAKQLAENGRAIAQLRLDKAKENTINVDNPINQFPSPQPRETSGYREQSSRPFGFSNTTILPTNSNRNTQSNGESLHTRIHKTATDASQG